MQRLWTAALMDDDSELAPVSTSTVSERQQQESGGPRPSLEDIDWATGFVTFRTKNKVVHVTCVSVDLLQRIRICAENNGGWSRPMDYDPKNFESVGTPAF